MHRQLLAFLCGTIAIQLVSGAWAADETALTIYSQVQPGAIDPMIYQPGIGGGSKASGYAVVRQTRQINLAEKTNRLAFSDIPVMIDPGTVQLRSLSDPAGTRLIEQEYRFDLVNQQKLLEKYIGQKISVDSLVGAASQTVEGTLISTQGGLTLLMPDGAIKIINAYSGITLPALPDGLLNKPTLIWDVSTAAPGEHQIEISYQTQGIDWWADYALRYHEGKDANSGTLDFDAKVSITNQTGMSYHNANLKLVAGDVQQVSNKASGNQRAMMIESAAADAGPAFAGKAFSEYHLYALNHPVSLPDKTTKQLPFMPAVAAIPVEKLLVYTGVDPQYWPMGGHYLDQGNGLDPTHKKVDVFLKFTNNQDSGLGVPLPGGRVRVSQRDDDGALEFIGESLIDHMPRNEEILIRLGNAFDVAGERKQISYVLDTDRQFAEEEIAITIRNQKKQAVSVKIMESLYRAASWTVKNTSQEFTKENANQISYLVRIDPEKSQEIRYTVRYSW